MAFDRQARFDVFGDVTAGIAGTVSVVNRDRYVDLACLELVPLNEASIDGTARASAIVEALSTKGLRSGDGIQDDVHHEVVGRALVALDDDGGFAEFV